MGAGHTLGEKAGEQAHTLTLPEIPQHSHAMAASGTTGQATSGNGNLPAAARGHYAQSGNTTMPALLANVGGSQPHLRSEEHTSELQSQSNLVCRLLLEKKKTDTGQNKIDLYLQNQHLSGSM